jgi:hypothetical protein
MSDDAPPKGNTNPKTMSGKYPQYAAPPMSYDDSEEDEETKNNSLALNAFHVLIFAMAAALTLSVWTLKADMSIILEYQKENTQQYSHIISLLQNMKQVQWQIVPAANP